MLLSPSPSFPPLVLLLHPLYSCRHPPLLSATLWCLNLHLPVFAPFNLTLTFALSHSLSYRGWVSLSLLLPVKAAAMTFNPCSSWITIACSYLSFSSLFFPSFPFNVPLSFYLFPPQFDNTLFTIIMNIRKSWTRILFPTWFYLQHTTNIQKCWTQSTYSAFQLDRKWFAGKLV